MRLILLLVEDPALVEPGVEPLLRIYPPEVEIGGVGRGWDALSIFLRHPPAPRGGAQAPPGFFLRRCLQIGPATGPEMCSIHSPPHARLCCSDEECGIDRQ